MRVLQVLPNLGVGGAERLVAHLAVYLKTHTPHEVRVLSLYSKIGSDISEMLETCGVSVYYLGKHRGPDFRMFPRIARIIDEYDPHIVHSHLYVLRYLLLGLWRHKRTFWIHTVHNATDRETDRAGLILNRWLYRKRVKPVAISYALGKSLESFYGLAKIPVIMNAIPLERYQVAESERINWRYREGLSSEDILLTCVARFSEQKNHGMLLRAFQSIARDVPNTKLLLVGDGELRSEIQGTIKELDLQDKVHLLGVRRDIPQILAASDLFLLPSSWEGTPLCVMEALSAGCPCVVTAVGGVPELVQEGVTGRVVPPGNAAAFANAVVHLLHDPYRMKEMRVQAKDYAMQHFGFEKMARAYLHLYENGVGQ